MNPVIWGKSENGCGKFCFYNTTIKTYADGTKKLKHSFYDITKGRPKGDETGGGAATSDEDREYQRYKNLYNSKQTLIDLAYHNSITYPWEYFVTLTFNDNIVNGYDYYTSSQALYKWLDNIRHQNPNARTLFVPEPHKSGRIHFHGLLANVPYLTLEEARYPHNGKLIKKQGSQIYNITNYKYGYSTCSKVKGQEEVSVYISKYMTKTLIDLNFKKRYWPSKNLDRPQIQYAYFDEEKLNFFIDKHKILDTYDNEKALFYHLSEPK